MRWAAPNSRPSARSTVYLPAVLLQELDNVLPLRRGSAMDYILDELLILLNAFSHR
jgi:hypothetical protein